MLAIYSNRSLVSRSCIKRNVKAIMPWLCQYCLFEKMTVKMEARGFPLALSISTIRLRGKSLTLRFLWWNLTHIKVFCCTKAQQGLPNWCGSVDWEPACEPKDCRFDSQSGCMPELQARSPAGGPGEETMVKPRGMNLTLEHSKLTGGSNITDSTKLEVRITRGYKPQHYHY